MVLLRLLISTALAASPATTLPPSTQLETYKDLISKARNLTLQRDRLQATQILIRGLQHESKGSAGYREISHALEELSEVFYTEKAQSLSSLADSLEETKPKDAIEKWTEALRLEEGNVALLKDLARAELRLGDCDAAEPSLRQAEALNPVSLEIKLIKLQILECQKKYDAVTSGIPLLHDNGFAAIETFANSLQMKDLWRRHETKKARTLLAAWERGALDYPEVYLWKWRTSGPPPNDRVAAQKYATLCQNLTPRKKKSYNLDIELCKSKSEVEEFLKEGPSSGTDDE